MDKLIVVVGERRSGTSLISNIFHNHGVWTGECRKADKFNKKGYFENIRISELVSIAHRTNMPQHLFKEKVKEILDDEGYDSGPWLVKHYVTFWHLWQSFVPVYVKVVRRRGSIFKSLVRIDSKFNNKETKDKIRASLLQLKEIPGISIRTNKLINGDYEQIQKVFKTAGIPLNKQIVENTINRKEWHYA